MASRLQFVPVVGHAGVLTWSQVLALPYGVRLDSEFVNPEVRVILAVSLSGEQVEAKGSDFLNGVREDEAAFLKEVPFSGAWLRERVSMYPEITSLVVVGFGISTVLCVGIGGARVVLKRQGKIGLIMAAPDRVWVARKGLWQPGDRLVIGTGGLVGEMSQPLLEEVVSMETMQLAGEELVTRVQSAEESAEAAGWVVEGKLQEKELEVLEEEEAPVALKARPPEVYLRKPKRKKMQVFMLALAVLIILGLSVVYTWNRREQTKWQEAYREVLDRVEPLTTTAQADSARDRTTVVRNVNEAISILEQAMPQFKTQENYRRLIEQKLQETRQLLTVVSGELGLTNVPVWIDLGLAKAGAYGTALAEADGLTVILDAQNGILFTIDNQTRDLKMAAGGELLKGARFLAATKGRAVVFGDKGLVDAALAKKTVDVLKAPEPEWKEIAGVGLFAGNVYLLDKGEGTIWQYPGLTAGVGSRRRWLTNTNQTLNTQAIDMAIDGDVWVLASNGMIERFRRGVKENFTVSGMSLEFKQTTALFTDENVDSLYVLDQGNTRVVVVSKDGVYQNQYVWQGFAAVTDIAVLAEQKALVAISGSSVYRIPLE